LGQSHGEFLSLLGTSKLPLVGQFVSNEIIFNALLYPSIVVALGSIGLPDTFNGLLWVLYLFNALISNLGQPQFKWFCPRTGNRLDNAEDGLAIAGVCEAQPIIPCLELELNNGIEYFCSVFFFRKTLLF